MRISMRRDFITFSRETAMFLASLIIFCSNGSTGRSVPIEAHALCQNDLPLCARMVCRGNRLPSIGSAGRISQFDSGEVQSRRRDDIVLLVWLYKAFASPLRMWQNIVAQNGKPFWQRTCASIGTERPVEPFEQKTMSEARDIAVSCENVMKSLLMLIRILFSSYAKLRY